MATTIEERVQYRKEWEAMRPDIPYGYCWCGCGTLTRIAKQTERRGSWNVGGEPQRYISAHRTASGRKARAAAVERRRAQALEQWKARWMADASVPYGTCQCGCGQPTRVAVRSRGGVPRGGAVRFVRGHDTRAVASRLEASYVPTDGPLGTPCWIWQRYLDPAGYARAGTRLAYRLMWEARNGPVPEGLELDHVCQTKACVNSDHIEAVSRAEHMRRGWARGQRS